MSKSFLALFLFSFITFSVFAQANTNANNILDKATVKINSSKGTSLNFSLTQKDKFGHVLSVSKGILKVKGSKYYLKQGSYEIYNNGAQIWNYDGQNEVTVAKVENDDDEVSPVQVITGFNKKDFDIQLTSSATIYQVQLTPVDKRKNYKQVLLYISKSTNLVSKAVITDKTNAYTEINFSGIAFNNTIPDSQFVFDPSKHPGVEVVNQ